MKMSDKAHGRRPAGVICAIWRDANTSAMAWRIAAVGLVTVSLLRSIIGVGLSTRKARAGLRLPVENQG